MTVMRICAIGECMVELAPAPGGLFRMGFAGDTFNTAWYLRRIAPADWSVAYLTGVGDDAISADLLAFIEKAGIETRFVRRVAGRNPGLYLIKIEAGERSFSYWRDTSAAKALADDEAHLDLVFTSAEAFYVSGITLAILAPDSRRRLFARMAGAREAGKTVAFDPNIRPRLWKDPAEMRRAIEQAASLSTICLPSFSDEAAAFGDADAKASARRYRGLGCGEVVVKDGSGDVIIATAAETVTIACAPIFDPVDTTAAGDSFNAAYLASRLAGGGLSASARAGHDLAGKVIRHYGALVETA